jgi:DNA repair protein RadA
MQYNGEIPGSLWMQSTSFDKISTGSSAFDELLGGGLPIASVTDIFGAAGTGKTQFAFQNIVTTCARSDSPIPCSVFVDCTGSFRPERIVEIAKARKLDAEGILDRIYTIYVRCVDEQRFAIERVAKEEAFSKCRLIVVDDATSNFVVEFGDGEIAARQAALSLYMRSLGVMANSRNVSVIVTNSARSRGDLGEGETTGEVFSQFALYRFHFERKDKKRIATLLQPTFRKKTISFEITESGIN